MCGTLQKIVVYKNQNHLATTPFSCLQYGGDWEYEQDLLKEEGDSLKHCFEIRNKHNITIVWWALFLNHCIFDNMEQL